MTFSLDLSTIPSGPGIYRFWRGSALLYVGKAAHLRKRLSSYFRNNVSAKISRLVTETSRVNWIETASEIEALIKEAEFIKTHRSRYNYMLRDDKNYFWVTITKEAYPKIFVTHQETDNQKLRIRYIGPFTDGGALKIALRLLRRLFPFCTCKTPHKRPCLNAQINRCPGYCCTITTHDTPDTIQEYKKNIQRIAAILGGKRTRLLWSLKRDMRAASKTQEYEHAAILRDQLKGIENIFQHRPTIAVSKNPRQSRWRRIERNLREILRSPQFLSRIEGYDISNISGTAATGSMVVFTIGAADKKEYRTFRIKTIRQSNDVAMLEEVIRRRLRHTEWRYPDLMVIDGGKPQLHAALAALEPKAKSMSRIEPRVLVRDQKLKAIFVAALAKREEELYLPGSTRPIRLDSLPPDTMFFLQRVRDESHRFAKKYHHTLRKKVFSN